MKVAREKRSSVLASNAIHHRVDSLTGIVTLVAIVGANVVENAGWLDPVGGLIISVMVAHAGIGNMMDSFHELVDQSIDDEVKDSVRRQARRALDGFDASHDALLRDVNGVKSGQNYLIDLEMAVPGGWSVDHVREMEESIRVHVGANVRGVRRVRVRFVSLEEPDKTGKFDEFINTDPQQCPATPTSEAGGETEEQKANGHNYNSVEGQARPRRRNSTKTD
jgi:divalent metal cation (Fe/Co/Zn/Cd) transporter